MRTRRLLAAAVAVSLTLSGCITVDVPGAEHPEPSHSFSADDPLFVGIVNDRDQCIAFATERLSKPDQEINSTADMIADLRDRQAEAMAFAARTSEGGRLQGAFETLANWYGLAATAVELKQESVDTMPAFEEVLGWCNIVADMASTLESNQ